MKIRDLERRLLRSGFRLVTGQGKGSHRKYTNGRNIVIMSGKPSDEAKPYQIKNVNRAIEDSKV